MIDEQHCFDLASQVDVLIDELGKTKSELEHIKKSENTELVGALQLLSDFLWYDSVPIDVKNLIVEKLDKNNVEYGDGWQEKED